MDIVLDTIGGDYQLRSLRTLRPGGILVSTLPRPAKGLRAEAERLGVRVKLILVEADHAGMQAIADLAAEGALKATIAGTFPLAEAAMAHEAGETDHTTGKLVIVMDEGTGSGD
ncbi:zinc-binding dehydrogenase [Arthrobacter woluwensis]|uniref:zinc-binding dehydrogenase n=1 Tax=Arthrobacter woluwensis TaxID=156980 RepID=UPI001FB97157|nr:zinc-binding dehydrogenase [Arthrobacter woluwensis]